jgi:GTPase SAR1 family protein
VTQDVLVAYEKAKFALGDILRTALGEASRAGMQDVEQGCRQLLNRLASDRFYVTVVGHFNRGKTTLMNAIAGADRLPTGILPATSVITCLSYGSRERALLRFRDRYAAREIEIGELAHHISESGNPGNRLGIEIAEVQLPSESLRTGLFLVDTPGLGSAIAANTKTTESFLPQADAILFVTSVEAPLSSEEMSLLRRTSELGRQIFLVLNKTDLVVQPVLDEIARYVREQVAKEIPAPHSIFVLSARRALEAKISGNAPALAGSHLPELEAALIEYLAVDRWQNFIRLMSQRTGALLAALPAKRAEPLVSQLACVESGAPPALQEGEMPRIVPTSAVSVRPCVICEEIDRAVFQLFSKFQYELTVDEKVRRTFAEHGGFCPFHGWQDGQLSSPVGIAIALPSLLGSLSLQFRSAEEGPIRAHLAENCLACDVAEAFLGATLGEVTTTAESSAEIPDLCVPHFILLQGLLQGGEAAERSRSVVSARLARLAEDLKRFVLKQSGVRRDLINEEERDAPGLSLNLLFGHKDVQPRSG